MLEVAPSWSTAAVLQRSTSAVAPQHSSQPCTAAKPDQPRDVYSMLMHGCGRVVSQSEAVTCTDTTTVDNFIRTLTLFTRIARLALTVPTHGPVELSGWDRRLPAHTHSHTTTRRSGGGLFMLFML